MERELHAGRLKIRTILRNDQRRKKWGKFLQLDIPGLYGLLHRLVRNWLGNSTLCKLLSQTYQRRGMEKFVMPSDNRK